jgi:hypothetical protein
MPILEEQDSDDMLYQQDGLPPHHHKEVMDFLNHNFPEKWIGSGGPITLITWPPRLPDLPSLDFFFWGTSRMYMSALATTLPEFAGRIRDAVATVTVNLYKMWTETEYR